MLRKRPIRPTTQQLANALDVSPETVRYHARKGTIPFETTPGRHRRFRLAAVKEALGLAVAPTAGMIVLDLDFSEPHREMSEAASARFQISAGRDERALIHEHERLDPAAPLAPFTVAGTARFAPARVLAGVSGVAH